MRAASLITRAAFLAALLLSCVGAPAPVETELRVGEGGQAVEMRIHLILFNTLTYGPVTVDDIEAQSDYTIVLSKEHPLIERKYRLLKSRPGRRPPDGYFIRMKVLSRLANRGEVFYADMAGNVVESTSGSLYSLTMDEMKKIEEDISYLEGVVDLKPESNMRDLGRIPQDPEGR